MSEEPKYIRQIEQDPDLHSDWFKRCTEEATAEGCTFGRYTVHPDNERFALVEGWEEQPADQGQQRWSNADA